MKIVFSGVFVDDQEKALQFYTQVLGFEKKTDIPMGEARWLTVTSPEGAAGVELLLEPNTHPAAKAFQKAIREDGIPMTSFASSDVQGEYERLSALGVSFTVTPTTAGPTTIAIFDDSCGNLIQIHQG